MFPPNSVEAFTATPPVHKSGSCRKNYGFANTWNALERPWGVPGTSLERPGASLERPWNVLIAQRATCGDGRTGFLLGWLGGYLVAATKKMQPQQRLPKQKSILVPAKYTGSGAHSSRSSPGGARSSLLPARGAQSSLSPHHWRRSQMPVSRSALVAANLLRVFSLCRSML